MPDRVIRESITTSDTVNALSDQGERLWHRLTVTADDFGRFDARPEVVRSRCFPLLLDEWPAARVETTLREIESANGCMLYEYQGRRYGAFRNWTRYQRTRAATSKFPGPNGERGHLSSDDDERQQMSLDSRHTHSTLDSGGSGGVRAAFDEFWGIYPRRVGKRAAQAAFERALHRATIAEVLAGATRYRDDPNRDPQFTAHPTTWLNQDRWGDDPLPSNGQVRSIRHSDRAAEILEEAMREHH